MKRELIFVVFAIMLASPCHADLAAEQAEVLGFQRNVRAEGRTLGLAAIAAVAELDRRKRPVDLEAHSAAKARASVYFHGLHDLNVNRVR